MIGVLGILQHREEMGSEGGAIYTITFEDVTNPGDVPLLNVYSEGLTGAGATVAARELVKGSEGVGSVARVGFSAPKHCSTSQVGVRHQQRAIAHITVFPHNMFQESSCSKKRAADYSTHINAF